MDKHLEKAVFGAGCFWCVESVFLELRGVESVQSGYAGGAAERANYKEVCSGLTKHAEVAQIIFDPSVIAFEQLLQVFWSTHDPTTPNRQGNDRGPQYRSAIFYLDEAQRLSAEKSKQEIATQLWSAPIVTEISPLQEFFAAEDYHQNYFKLNPGNPYCQLVINPKLKKFRANFAGLLKKD